MPNWLQWINPTIWTPEWVSAIGSGVAAIGGAGTLIIAIVLISKQHTSLTKTIELAEKQAVVLDETLQSLAEEKALRAEERARQRQEQASKVRLEPFQHFPNKRDTLLVSANIKSAGIPQTDIESRFKVTNASGAPITSVHVDVEHGNGPRCYTTDFEEYAGANPLAVLPPGQSARFYWIGHVPDLAVYVEFTDEAGVRWRRQYRDGLSEVAG